MQDFEFDGTKALVIGGSSGIGLALARELYERGAAVTVTGRNCPREMSDVLDFIRLDFERDGIECLETEPVLSVLEECDVLAVCYGPFVQKALHQTSSDDWKNVALNDLALPGLAVSLALPGMMERGMGKILLFGGTRTDRIRSYRTNAAYAAAKTALDVIVKSVAASYGSMGITCCAVCPGFTRNAPSPEYLVPEKEVAEEAVKLLAAPDSNGMTVRVDRNWEP